MVASILCRVSQALPGCVLQYWSPGSIPLLLATRDAQSPGRGTPSWGKSYRKVTAQTEKEQDVLIDRRI